MACIKIIIPQVRAWMHTVIIFTLSLPELYYCTVVVVLYTLSHFQLFATLWTAVYQASLSFTISRNLLKIMSIESVMSSNLLILYFSFSPQYFPASESFPLNWLFTSGSQSIGALASASVPTMNIQGWFPLGLTG